MEDWQSRLHFVKESDRRRRAVLSELTRAGVSARVYRTQSMGNRVSQREAARAGGSRDWRRRIESIAVVDRRI